MFKSPNLLNTDFFISSKLLFYSMLIDNANNVKYTTNDKGSPVCWDSSSKNEHWRPAKFIISDYVLVRKKLNRLVR